MGHVRQYSTFKRFLAPQNKVFKKKVYELPPTLRKLNSINSSIRVTKG